MRRIFASNDTLRIAIFRHQRFATTSASVAAEKPEKPAAKQSSDDWKVNLIKQLDSENKLRRQRRSREFFRRNSLADVVRYTLKDDMRSLVRLAENLIRSRQTEEIVPVCFLVFYKKFESIMKKVEDINSNQSLSLFISISDLWKSLKRTDDNTTNAMSLLLLSTVRKWKDERKFDAKSSSVEDLFDEMSKKSNAIIRDIRSDQLQVFVNEVDQKTIENEIEKLKRFQIIRKQPWELTRYDRKLELVSSLQANCSHDEYRNNPFQIDQMSQEVYKDLFEKHLELESSMWMRVKNSVANESEIERYAEDLISEWQWARRIRDNLEKINPSDSHPLVGACLELIPRNKLVELLNFSAEAACSQGQNLIGASIFECEVLMPIIKELANIFKKRMGFDEDKTWRNVFSNYAQYFEDSNISRNNTHREWWNKACKKENVAPNYQFDMGRLDVETRNEVGSVFIDVLMNSCIFPVVGKESKRETWQRAFSFRSISIEEESKISADPRLSLSRMLSINSNLMKRFDEHPFEYIVFSTENLPMTVPPRPWIDYGDGGPLYRSSVEVVRNMAEFRGVYLNQEMRRRIKSAEQARPVFDALNQLGSTPWVINERMLDVLKTVFRQSERVESRPLLEKLGIPMKEATFDIPDFVSEFGRNTKKEQIEPEKFRDYAKRKAQAIKERNESNSLWCWMLYRVVLADHFRGKTLFFPHNMDFRGRVYPLSPYLSHMGDDVNRCILKFAKAKPLGPNGYDWLKLHCVNLTGTMKRSSIADRMVEAERLLPVMLDSARNPLNGERWWMESDEPWQTLAACMEIQEAMKYGSDVASFASQLPVHQDGSCNGLQHYAALGRDNEGGTQVNLTKCDVPMDVYSDVAQRVEQKRLQDEQSNGEDSMVARRLREALPQNVPRKVIKQTVMTTVYGVTMYGAVLQIKRQLRALDINNEDSALFARYLARKTFSSLNDAFTSSMALKDWFRLIAKGTSELMRTVEWVTPLGLPVVQPYSKVIERKMKLILAPIPMKQVDAFPPNFVHSLDSTHMMLTSLNCAHRGITFAAVHDCFWTHASSVDEMNRICREQFVQLHNQPIVEQCSEWFKKTYLTPQLQKIMPKAEFERFEDVFTAKVAPGNLDIDQVKESIYFFS